jgi:WD40 repeat protein
MTRRAMGRLLAWGSMLMMASGVWADSPDFIPAGHSQNIVWCSWSPDQTRLATAADDGQILIWDVATGRILQRMPYKQQGAYQPKWSPDGKRLLGNSSSTYMASVWDVDSGRQLIKIYDGDLHPAVGAFSSDGAKVLLGCGGGRLAWWNVASGEIQAFGSGGSRSAFRLSADASLRRAVALNGEGHAVVFDVETGKQLHTLPSGTETFRNVIISSQGHLAATHGQGPRVCLWDLETGQQKFEWQEAGNWIENLAFSEDGTRLVTTDSRMTVIWDTRSGERIAMWQIDRSRRGQPERTARILASTDALWPTLWDLEKGVPLRSLKPSVASVNALAAINQGNNLLVGDADGVIANWDMQTGRLVRAWQASPNSIQQISVNQDGQRLVVSPTDEALSLWAPSSGEKIRDINGSRLSGAQVSLNPQGTRLMASQNQNEVVVHDCETGESTPLCRGRFIRALGWSPAGDKCWVGSTFDHLVTLWDAASLKPLGELKSPFESATSGAFSPDGTALLVGYGSSRMSQTILWDPTQKKPTRTFVGHREAVSAVCFRADGQRIATACEQGIVCIWSVADGRELARFQAHRLGITGIYWQPQDRWLATASHDGTVGLWDPTSGQERCRLVVIDQGREWLILAPDGRYTGSPQALEKLNLHQQQQFLQSSQPNLWQNLFGSAP